MTTQTKSKSWTRGDLIEAVYQKMTLPHPDCVKAIECLLMLIREGLKRDGDVKIHAFATFKVHPQAARPGRNPRTKEPKLVPAHNLVLFKRSKVLDEKLNVQKFKNE